MSRHLCYLIYGPSKQQLDEIVAKGEVALDLPAEIFTHAYDYEYIGFDTLGYGSFFARILECDIVGLSACLFKIEELKPVQNITAFKFIPVMKGASVGGFFANREVFNGWLK